MRIAQNCLYHRCAQVALRSHPVENQGIGRFQTLKIAGKRRVVFSSTPSMTTQIRPQLRPQELGRIASSFDESLIKTVDSLMLFMFNRARADIPKAVSYYAL